MESNKEYRFLTNPDEKVFHDEFKNMFENLQTNTLSGIIFGWKENTTPNDFLTERERSICLNMIQWLGSPVGKSFLNKCNYHKKENA